MATDRHLDRPDGPAAAEWAAAAVAAARGAAAVHPRGRAFHATVHTRGGGRYGVALLDRPGDHRALVRFSRGAGLPPGWPDVLGVALRVRDGGGPGVDVDLLASTTAGRAPLARHLPAPRRRLATTYTTVAGYRTRRGRRYLAVLPDPAAGDPGTDLDTLAALARRGRAAFLLAIAAPLGRWHVFGRLRVGEPVAAEREPALAFDPIVRAAAGLRPEGPLWRLRAAAYRGSRHSRGGHLTAADEGL